jgi:hypothetical protein
VTEGKRQQRVVPRPASRQVRDLPGSGEFLPKGGAVVDTSHPHWGMLQRIGWVTIHDIPKKAEGKRNPSSAREAAPPEPPKPAAAPKPLKAAQKKGSQKKGSQKKGSQKKAPGKSWAEKRAEATRLKAESKAAKE